MDVTTDDHIKQNKPNTDIEIEHFLIFVNLNNMTRGTRKVGI